MSDFKKVKTAVVGCGAVSDIYLENMLKKFFIFEVVGCCDVNNQVAASQAAKYNIKVLELEEILKDETIELVVNLTPPSVHYDMIKNLLEAGKNVYTEKVLSIQLEHAEELVRIANEKNLYLGAAPDTFLGSSIQTSRQIVESGLIGEVTSFVASVNRDYGMLAEFMPYLIQPGGGIGFDVGIYYVTALISILGPVKEVTGFMKTNRKNRNHDFVKSPVYGEPYEIKNENIMVGSMILENGILGNIHFNSDSILEEHPQLVIYGTQGILYMSDPNKFGGEVKVVRKGQSEPFVIQENFGYSENSRGLGAAEMAWSIRKERVPRANKEMALHGLEVLHGIAISSETKSNYMLKSTFEKMRPLPQGYIDKFGNPEASLAK